MIGRKSKQVESESDTLMSFDDFSVTLGDAMRGERATMGKSLMDVQRELKIKAAYIAAVEDADPSVFDTPGFIAGYVRSYAKYLGLDPEWAFEKFCAESGFSPVHGMSEAALPARQSRNDRLMAIAGQRANPLERAATPYVPPADPLWTRIDAKAVLSSVVLLCLIGTLGYGAFNVVSKVQQVQLTPIEQPPMVASDINPIAPREGLVLAVLAEQENDLQTPSADALNRMYQPVALETQVPEAALFVARDGPIASIKRGSLGVLAPAAETGFDLAALQTQITDTAIVVPAAETVAPPKGISIIAVEGVWVRVRDASGAKIFETTLNAGDTFEFPEADESFTLRAGNSGALYFNLNGEFFGPAGNPGRLVKNVAVSETDLLDRYTKLESLPAVLEQTLAQNAADAAETTVEETSSAQ